MKKIYYLLVCLFFLQSAFAAGEKQSFDVCLQNGLKFVRMGYSGFGLLLVQPFLSR